MIHRLKTWTVAFADTLAGQKTAEVRKNDRDFQAGDVLLLEEWNETEKAYTGRRLARRVTHVLAGGRFGLPERLAVLSTEVYVPRCALPGCLLGDHVGPCEACGHGLAPIVDALVVELAGRAGP